MKIESPFDLMGLYHGVSLNNKSVMDPASRPDMVFLYRRPMLDYWAEQHETLGDLVTHVLVHEIGHHFGLSDADMERIEASAGGRVLIGQASCRTDDVRMLEAALIHSLPLVPEVDVAKHQERAKLGQTWEISATEFLIERTSPARDSTKLGVCVALVVAC